MSDHYPSCPRWSERDIHTSWRRWSSWALLSWFIKVILMLILHDESFPVTINLYFQIRSKYCQLSVPVSLHTNYSSGADAHYNPSRLWREPLRSRWSRDCYPGPGHRHAKCSVSLGCYAAGRSATNPVFLFMPSVLLISHRMKAFPRIFKRSICTLIWRHISLINKWFIVWLFSMGLNHAPTF